MKYFYDQATDSLYLTLADRRYGDSLEAAPGVVLDFDSTGRLIGIDLEHASKTIDVADLSLYAEPSQSERTETKIGGAEVKRQREALGLSQVQLAQELGVAANTIARWERGELKIEHPGMLLLAINALSQHGRHMPARTESSALTRQAHGGGLLKRNILSSRGLASRTRRSGSPPKHAKRK